jgi:hypothetical protein
MESTTNEFVKLFRDRLKYPIITVYGILLIIYNWDVLGVFFLSNKNIEDRIIYINTVFKGETWSRLLWPLCKAILVSILAPAIMLGLEWTQKFINKPRQKIKDQKVKDSWNLKKSIAHDEFEYEQFKSGSKTISEWKDRVNELTSQLELQQENFNRQIKAFQQANDVQQENIDNYNSNLLRKNEEIKNIQQNLKEENEKVITLQKYVNENAKIIDRFVESISKTYIIDSNTFYSIILAISGKNQNLDSLMENLISENHLLTTDHLKSVIKGLISFGIINQVGELYMLSDFGRDLYYHTLPF